MKTYKHILMGMKYGDFFQPNELSHLELRCIPKFKMFCDKLKKQERPVMVVGFSCFKGVHCGGVSVFHLDAHGDIPETRQRFL